MDIIGMMILFFLKYVLKEGVCYFNFLKIEKYKYIYKVWDFVRFVVDNILIIYLF